MGKGLTLSVKRFTEYIKRKLSFRVYVRESLQKKRKCKHSLRGKKICMYIKAQHSKVMECV